METSDRRLIRISCLPLAKSSGRMSIFASDMTDAPPPKPPAHSLADHAFGATMGHVHGEGEDHDHDHDADGSLIEAGSQELARVELTSIGIDIGSSGTQVAFSRLFMHGPGEPAAMRRQIRSRETLYLSPVVLTPFRGANEIDIERLRGSVARSFEAAGLRPDDIETGAVIMTGAAARRANAAAIVEALAFETGDIVTAAAGDHLEAALAAAGSGAVERSRAEIARILNVDIGGASTKLALVENGRIIATAALSAGGRLVALDAGRRIGRLEPEAVKFAERCGLSWTPGATVTVPEMERVASRMASDIVSALTAQPLPGEIADLFLTRPFQIPALDGIMFSGGVAEYIYGRETRDFGDCGLLLGRSLKQIAEDGGLPAPLLPAGECVRATVLGCSEYALQMSGATSCISSHAALLPRRNLPVLQPHFDFSGEIVPDHLAQAITRHRAAFGDDDPLKEVAFAFRWRGDAEHSRVDAFARGLAEGLADRIAARSHLYILTEGDVAQTLGAILRLELGVPCEMLVIDGIVLRDFDYIDIGRLRLPSGMVPVVVKSLVFSPAAAAQGGAHRQIA